MELCGSYRHELKYPIGPAEYHALRQRLRTVMKRDSHAGADGLYTIRSVYFDNYRDKALREKVDGVQRREKFRIRYYNDDLSFITLEKKIKQKDRRAADSGGISEAPSAAGALDAGASGGAGAGALLQNEDTTAPPTGAGVLCAGALCLRRRQCPRDL